MARLRIGFSGHRAGAVARALAAHHADVRDYHASADPGEFDVVLIDASSKVRLDDRTRLQTLIAAGVSVGWIDADPMVLDAVAAVFGCQFERASGLLMIADVNIQGQRCRRIETVAGWVPEIPVRRAAVDESGTVSSVAVTLHAPAADELAKLIADAVLRDWRRTLPAATSLIPPNGAAYSVTQFTNTYSTTLPGTGWATGGTTTQTVSWSYNTSSYQYYANGNGGNQYQVILISDFSALPGTIANNGGACRNWVQTQVQPSVSLTASGPNTITNTVHTPPSAASPQPVNEVVSQQMAFQIEGQPQAWTASYANSYQIADWAMVDQSDVGTGLTQWLFYETTLWNPTIFPPADFGNWWQGMYDGNGNVNAFPTASLKTYNVEVASGWAVSGNPGNKGSLNVIVDIEALSGYYAFANPNGTGNGHHQIEYFVDSNNNPILVGGNWSVSIDLIAST